MKMQKLLAVLLASLLLGTGAGTVLAHDDATLNAHGGAHGGQLRQAGPYHLELVVAKDASESRDSAVTIYLTGHDGAKLPSAGGEATATILSGKQKTSAVLKPDGDNRLKGQAKYTAGADMKVVVTLSLPGKPVEQARFTPFAGH